MDDIIELSLRLREVEGSIERALQDYLRGLSEDDLRKLINVERRYDPDHKDAICAVLDLEVKRFSAWRPTSSESDAAIDEILYRVRDYLNKCRNR